LVNIVKQASISNDSLFEGLPHEFYNYFDHVHSLKFSEKPDYSYLQNLFKSLFVEYEFKDDSIYDWQFLDSQKLNHPDVLYILTLVEIYEEWY
jgi:hypothetical protein